MTSEEQEPAIKILPYDSKAPDKFEKIKAFICDLVPFSIEVEHIGSTAVVDLGGKEVIDVMIITEKENMRKIIELLESKGYKFNPEPGFGTFPERFFISGPFRYDDEELHVHYHITFSGSNEHKDKLLFRDYLKCHSDDARTYYNLKKEWSIKAGTDKIRFAELKTSYINEVLEKARKELREQKSKSIQANVS